MNISIVIQKRTVLQNFIGNVLFLSVLMGAVWFNQMFIGGSYVINAVILILISIFIIGLAESQTKKFKSIDEAILFLQEEKRLIKERLEKRRSDIISE